MFRSSLLYYYDNIANYSYTGYYLKMYCKNEGQVMEVEIRDAKGRIQRL